MIRIIGHRGASGTHQENTIEAFQAAADQGADGVELDVRRTADDVLVVFHDAHLGSGALVRELLAADLPPWIPTLAEALEACADLWINIEIKNMPEDPDHDTEHGLSVAVAGLVQAFDMVEQILVSSFDIGSIDRIRSLDLDIALAWLVWGQADPRSLVERAVAHGLQAINPNDLLVDRGFVRMAHEVGLEVNVWTVDDGDRIVALAEMGVDGIITNVPAAARAALASR
ncbi:MAG: glycerophosphodiester phosphodiesterase [Acidimicrobiales bacterium]